MTDLASMVDGIRAHLNVGDFAPTKDAALSSRVRQAVADLNQAAADAAAAGIEVQVSLIEHQTVGSAFKRQLVAARLVRPIAGT